MHSGDQALVQIVDRALAEAALKSGSWLVCRPGCYQCCLGPFPISQLDGIRLKQGLRDLALRDPERASTVQSRARAARERTDELDDDEACPVLDPGTGTCDLYAWRPMTCRIFGPPVRFGQQAVGVCELCFEGASDEEIAACSVEIDARIEATLNADVEKETGLSGPTTVAHCLA